MMAKPSERRKQKRFKHAQKQRQRKSAVDRAAKWPRFILKPNNAPADFVKLIESGLRQLYLGDSRHFEKWEIDAFRLQKTAGFNRAVDSLTSNGITESMLIKFATSVGAVLFSILPQDELLKWMPFNSVVIGPNSPYGRDYIVQFGSLQKKTIKGSNIFFSSKQPTVRLNGHSYVVAFTKHAIERTCERIVSNWQGYSGLGDAYIFFHNCCNFELNPTSDYKLAFTFYQPCLHGFASWNYPEHVIENPSKTKNYYHRVGYCPAYHDDQYIVAKTLLFPGQRKTPEYHAIQTSDLSHQEKARMCVTAGKLTSDYLYDTGDFSLIKWFHDQGIDQVVELGDIPNG